MTYIIVTWLVITISIVGIGLYISSTMDTAEIDRIVKALEDAERGRR